MVNAAQWVMDTSTYTHFCRAGRADILRRLAPSGIILVPSDVSTEIEAGRERYASIPSVSEVSWAQVVVLTDAELMTQLGVKAQLGGGPMEHLGECAVIACARHRSLTAILDEREAVAQADRLGVPTRDTMWIVIEAYVRLLDRDRTAVAQVVDDLLSTGMYLPITSGESVLARAYEEGLLP